MRCDIWTISIRFSQDFSAEWLMEASPTTWRSHWAKGLNFVKLGLTAKANLGRRTDHYVLFWRTLCWNSNILAQVVRNMFKVLEADIDQQIREIRYMTRYLANISKFTRYPANVSIIPQLNPNSRRQKIIWMLSSVLHCLTSILFLGKGSVWIGCCLSYLSPFITA